MKCIVRKLIEFSQEVEAETPEEALGLFDSGQATLRLVRESAKAPRTPAGRTIADRTLKPGRRFVAHYKGRDWRAEVGGDGLIRVEGIDREFKSLSTAGSAVTGHACNGWAFWKDAPAEEQAAAPQPVREPERVAPTAPPKKRARKKVAAPAAP